MTFVIYSININMSPAYGWCDEMAPADYGLVVIDFKNKKIHTCQGYDSPGQEMMALSSNVVHDKKWTNDFDFIVTNNLLYVHSMDDEYLGDISSHFGPRATLKSLQARLRKPIMVDPTISMLNFIIASYALYSAVELHRHSPRIIFVDEKNRVV